MSILGFHTGTNSFTTNIASNKKDIRNIYIHMFYRMIDRTSISDQELVLIVELGREHVKGGKGGKG